MALTLWLRAGAGPYLPLVHPVEELPAAATVSFWASERLVGTQDGVYRLEGAHWRNVLSGRPTQALGELPGNGWWAAGTGFIATSQGILMQLDEAFTSGCLDGADLYLAGKKGVWLLHGDQLKLIHAQVSPNRLRLFRLLGRVCLLAEHQMYQWDGARFVPHPQLADRQILDAIAAHPATEGGDYLLAFEGLFHLTSTEYRPVYPEAVKAVQEKGAIDFQIGEHGAYLGAYFFGLRAIDDSGQVRWDLSLKELGGNLNSMLKTKDGFLIGTTNRGYRVFSEAFYRMPLPGEYIRSVDDRVHLSSGAIDLRTGAFTPGVPGVEGDGAYSRDWARVVLPGNRTVHVTGREVQSIAAYQDGWVVVQEAVLTHLDAAGNILERLPLVGAYTGVVEGKNVWIGSANNLYRYDGQTLTRVISGQTVQVAHGVASPVFFTGDALRYPDGREQKIPGKVLAVDGEFAAIQIGDAPFVGRYRGNAWHPLDVPGLPAGIKYLRHDGDWLYAITQQEIFRIQLSKTSPLSIRRPGVRELSLQSAEFSARLPDARPAPWLNPHYQVIAGGEPVPVVNGAYIIPRLPYGDTEVRVTTSLGGLVSHEDILLHRLRPWWLDWPGGVLYLLALSGGVAGLIRWRTHRLTLRARELQAQVDERTKSLNEALKARELFFSSVSHEIRNPLNGVVGLCDMLNEASVGSRERLLVKTLKSCSDQLRRILDDVLDFARIDRGELELHTEIFELGPAVDGAARAVDPTLERVQLSVPDGVWVEGDVGKLRQVVTNLVSNAIKYGQPPMAKVEVLHEPAASGHLAVEVRVINTGPDLPPAEQQSIFEGFQRGEEAKRRRLPGSGLGLALSRRMMRAMNGDLTVTSTGGLTTFVLSVTLTPASPAEDAILTVAPARSSRALAIEDEHYNRLVLGHILGQLGYEVDWAVDGTAAIEAVKTSAYDLILTDYMLPDMDGLAVTRQILATVGNPAPPIVMVTAYSTREKQEGAHAAGISGFVTKPVTLKKLQAALLGLGYGLRGRRSLDVFRPAGRFDFAVFQRMNDGRVALGEFADQFEADFQGLLGLVDRPEALRKAPHARRGRSLVVHATTLAEQLGTLEEAAETESRDQAIRHLSVIEPMVKDLADTARNHVFSTSDFGKPLG